MLPCKDFVKFVVSTEETKVKLAIFFGMPTCSLGFAFGSFLLFWTLT